MTGSQFADDLALYTVTQSAFKSAGRKFVEVASCCGLTVSLPKAEGVAIETALSKDDVSPAW